MNERYQQLSLFNMPRPKPKYIWEALIIRRDQQYNKCIAAYTRRQACFLLRKQMGYAIRIAWINCVGVQEVNTYAL